VDRWFHSSRSPERLANWAGGSSDPAHGETCSRTQAASRRRHSRGHCSKCVTLDDMAARMRACIEAIWCACTVCVCVCAGAVDGPTPRAGQVRACRAGLAGRGPGGGACLELARAGASRRGQAFAAVGRGCHGHQRAACEHSRSTVVRGRSIPAPREPCLLYLHGCPPPPSPSPSPYILAGLLACLSACIHTHLLHIVLAYGSRAVVPPQVFVVAATSGVADQAFGVPPS
jgi:hypothetical protein